MDLSILSYFLSPHLGLGRKDFRWISLPKRAHQKHDTNHDKSQVYESQPSNDLP